MAGVLPSVTTMTDSDPEAQSPALSWIDAFCFAWQGKEPSKKPDPKNKAKSKAKGKAAPKLKMKRPAAASEQQSPPAPDAVHEEEKAKPLSMKRPAGNAAGVGKPEKVLKRPAGVGGALQAVASVLLLIVVGFDSV